MIAGDAKRCILDEGRENETVPEVRQTKNMLCSTLIYFPFNTVPPAD